MELMVRPLLMPMSESDLIRSSMLASLGSSVRACASRRSSTSFSCLNCARLLAMDCFWMRSSSSVRSCPCFCWISVSLGSTRKYQLPAVTSAATTATTAIFCGRGSLLTALRTSCPLSAMDVPLGRVIRGAGDDPVDDPVAPLRRAPDDDVAEVLRGLQLLGERREVLVGRRAPVDGHSPARLGPLDDPDALRNDGGQLVHHLHRSGAALLERLEDLELVLERLLLLLDRLDLADGLLQLRNLGAGAVD